MAYTDQQKRVTPINPLEFICGCLRETRVFWTYHVNMRLEERSITRETILSSVNNMEIIEEYPDDKYFPSYLLRSRYENIWYHILIAVDLVGNNVRVVTAYLPSLSKWEPDFKTRRRCL